MKTSTRFGLMAATIALATLSGCATRSQLKEVRRETQTAQATADQSLALAQNSQQTAQLADQRARNSEEMTNRSFRRSMLK